MVLDESKLVIDRLNGLGATQAILLQAAVGALFSKKAGKEFQKLIKGLTDDGKA